MEHHQEDAVFGGIKTNSLSSWRQLYVTHSIIEVLLLHFVSSGTELSAIEQGLILDLEKHPYLRCRLPEVYIYTYLCAVSDCQDSIVSLQCR